MREIYMLHPTEDELERFAMKRSEESELDEVEGHLLGCQNCLDRVLELESFVQAFRTAIPVLREEQSFAEAKVRRGTWLGWFSVAIPKWSWAPALAALVVAVVLLPVLRRPQSTFDATLSAARGVEIGPLLPPATSIRLHLDAMDLPAAAVQVELVDGEGHPVWSGSSSAQAGRVTVETPRLKTGTYFARLYPLHDGHADPNHPFREFVFQVR